MKDGMNERRKVGKERNEASKEASKQEGSKEERFDGRNGGANEQTEEGTKWKELRKKKRIEYRKE